MDDLTLIRTVLLVGDRLQRTQWDDHRLGYFSVEVNQLELASPNANEDGIWLAQWEAPFLFKLRLVIVPPSRRVDMVQVSTRIIYYPEQPTWETGVRCYAETSRVLFATCPIAVPGDIIKVRAQPLGLETVQAYGVSAETD